MTPTPPSIVFDLDGTLVDTLQDIGEAMNRTLVSEGFDAKPLDFYTTAIGDGVKILLERCLHPRVLEADRASSILSRFKQDYAENMLANSRLYPGIADVLDELEALQVPKAVFSNKPDRLTRRMVDALMDRWTFTAVQGQLEGVPHKPDPGTTLGFLKRCGFTATESWMVGDTRTDMNTATASGMTPIGVSWGFRSEQELLDHGAQAILHTPDELLERLQSGRDAVA